MTTINMPAPFTGTPEQRAANEASHSFFTFNIDSAEWRCMNCDCRPGSTSACYPCGADVPRIEVTR